MLTFINRRNLCAKAARASALGVLALAATLFQAGEARAQWTTSGTNTTTTNNVGIGTTAPTDRLEINGNVANGAGITVTTSGTAKYRVGTVGTTVPNWGGQIINARYNQATGYWTQDDPTLGSAFMKLDLRNHPNGNEMGFYRMAAGGGNPASPDAAWSPLAQFKLDTGNILLAPGSGQVGIGTAAPQSLLDISGSTGMTLRTSAASSGFSIFDRPSVPGDQLVFQGNKGTYSLFNVSTRGANIGTEKGSGMAFWTVDIANTANATQFQMHYAPNYGPVFFTQKFGTGVQGDKKISFQTAWQNTAVAPSQLVLDTSGYVGVGTAAPVERLHVAGNIRVDGNINAKYQDVAEWVPSVEKLSAGTVVILDVARDNHVAASSTSYDTRVAGVISAQPGISLGEAGEGKVLVATTGRVKVRVDATQGPINVGDLLVTSDRQGFAMKSEPVQVGKRQMHSPGTIIGKALESLAGGTGEILVLLSLQ